MGKCMQIIRAIHSGFWSISRKSQEIITGKSCMGIEVGVRTGILILCQNRVFVVVWKWLCSRLREGYPGGKQGIAA